MIDYYRKLKVDGFVLLPEYKPELSLEVIAKEMGRLVEIPKIPTVQTLIPRHKEEVPPNLYSGHYGYDEFPLHTDLAHWYIPPHYLMLRCIEPAYEVYTFVVHQKNILKQISPLTIRRALYKPRRKQNGQQSILRLFQSYRDKTIFRWDQLFIEPENDEALEIANHIKRIRGVDVDIKICFSKRGDTLILDNWTMLHGRSSVPPSGSNRVLERIYMSEVNH